MKLGIGCLMLLLLSLVLPMAAQVETRTGPNGSTGQNAPTVLTVTGGTGGGSGGLGFPSGSGGGVRLTSGTGGFPFGSGGGMQFTSGAGAAAAGGCPIPPGPPCSNSAGAGGLVRIMGGTGGAGARSGSAFSSGGSGGSITLQPGAGGTAGLNGRHGASGNVLLAPSFGRVGIGFSSPTVTLDVTPGGGTLSVGAVGLVRLSVCCGVRNGVHSCSCNCARQHFYLRGLLFSSDYSFPSRISSEPYYTTWNQSLREGSS